MMRWFWGLLIISIGALILGQNLGLWHNFPANQLAQFWPMILILFGIALIVKHLKFGWIIMLIAFAIAIAIIYWTITNSNHFNIPIAQNGFIDLFRKFHR